MTTTEQLREIRANLPKGMKDPWGACCKSKRVLLRRAIAKQDISELTTGELAVVVEYQEYLEKTKRESTALKKELERNIAKLAKK